MLAASAPAAVVASASTPALGKGVCRHCGKKVGRGIHIHEKACRG